MESTFTQVLQHLRCIERLGDDSQRRAANYLRTVVKQAAADYAEEPEQIAASFATARPKAESTVPSAEDRS